MVIAVCLMETPAECICYIEVLRLSAFVIHLDSNCFLTGGTDTVFHFG